MPFQMAAPLCDLPADRGLRVEIEGNAIALFRVGEAVYAMEDVCPHAGIPLSDGVLEDCVVTCWAHGWPFDVRTGFDPQHADGFPIPCFAVEIRGDEVHVDLDQQINDPRKRNR